MDTINAVTTESHIGHHACIGHLKRPKTGRPRLESLLGLDAYRCQPRFPCAAVGGTSTNTAAHADWGRGPTCMTAVSASLKPSSPSSSKTWATLLCVPFSSSPSLSKKWYLHQHCQRAEP